MSNLIESSVEQFAIKLLQLTGWDFMFCPYTTPDFENNRSKIANRIF